MSNIFHFDGTHLLPADDPLEPGASPDIADSFLLRDGRVRDWAAHRDRFARDVDEHAPHLSEHVTRFYRACAQQLAGISEAFPRCEVVNGMLWLRIRPAPNTSSEVRGVSTPLEVSLAEVKGPNISLYAELNTKHDAETIRLTQTGHVLEGVTSALLWWDDQTLCSPPQLNRVYSTTEHAILTIARERGVTLREQWITPSELATHEVWAVNAVHGIRRLSSLDAVSLPDPNIERLEQFRADFEATWLPLSQENL